MKKCIRIIFMALLIFFILFIIKLPTKSYAATTVSEVYIAGIDEPGYGNNPDITGITGKGYKIDDIIWHDDTTGTWLEDPSSKFEWGHVYTVSIDIQTENNYEFDYITSNKPNVTGYVNNKLATVTKRYEYAAWAGLTVTYTWDLSVVKTIKVNGGVAPAIGQKFSTSWTSSEPSLYNITNITWYNVTDNRKMEEGINDTFEAGKIYKLILGFNAMYGFTFDNTNNMTAVLNNVNSNCYSTKISGSVNRTVEFTFDRLPSDETIIQYITFENGEFPYKGQKPDYSWSIPDNEGYDINSIKWISANENNKILDPTDTFKLNYTYYLDIVIVPKIGYRFASPGQMHASLTDITENYITQIYEAGQPDDNGDKLNRFIRFIFVAKKPIYTVRFETTTSGSYVPLQQIEEGGYVTKPTPDPTTSLEGYAFENWYRDTRYTKLYDFNAPVTSSFTLYAKFVNVEPPFPDVENGQWYTEGIRYCKENGLIGGYTAGPNAGNFGPNDNITRGQIVTILWRHAGKPESEYAMNFFDIKNPNEYYYKAVKWAAENGIVTGYLSGENAGKFKPDDNITREQLALILQRYAGYCGKNSTTQGDISKFPDAKKVSDWALTGIKWAVGVGIISGQGNGNLDPLGTATRAEAATMIMRFLKM